MGVPRCVFPSQLSALDEFGGHAVVLGMLGQHTGTPQIGPAIADVDNSNVSVGEEPSRGDRGAHAVQSGLGRLHDPGWPSWLHVLLLRARLLIGR